MENRTNRNIFTFVVIALTTLTAYALGEPTWKTVAIITAATSLVADMAYIYLIQAIKTNDTDGNMKTIAKGCFTTISWSLVVIISGVVTIISAFNYPDLSVVVRLLLAILLFVAWEIKFQLVGHTAIGHP